MSLEAVQEFYKKIGEEPINASMGETFLLDFCNQFGFNELDYFPVITLTKTSSTTGKTQGHAVVVCDYYRYEDALVVTTIDSAFGTEDSMIVCPIFVDKSCWPTKPAYQKTNGALDRKNFFYFN